MPRAIVYAPKTAQRGEVIEIRSVIAHPMETGQRSDGNGGLVPRNVITRLECRYDGEVVFAADLYPAIAANPFISFFTVATESGTFDFSWIGDQGFSETASAAISVE